MAIKEYLGKEGIAKLKALITAAFLSKNQGAENAGKALVVGNDGTVAPDDISADNSFRVNFDVTADPPTADKTAAEILAAYDAGAYVYGAAYSSIPGVRATATLQFIHGAVFNGISTAVFFAEGTEGITGQFFIISGNSVYTQAIQGQPLLESGTNIKTLNNTSLLGSGNISLTLANIPDDTGHRSVSDAEKTNWNGKQDAIPDETYDEYGAAAAVQDNLDDVTELIPSQATSSNQLADKAFVNSSVQTATANFRGNWSTWTAIPTDATLYPADYAGSKTPTVNDYLVVVDASDYSGSTLEGTWRFKYSGTWATDGKSGWQPEYQVNETPLTAAQLAALNSNVTDGKVSTYDAHVADEDIHVTASQKTEWSGKGEAPTLNIETQTALTPSDNTIYAFTVTSAVTITATGSTCPLYGSDILVTIGTGGSVTLSVAGTAGEDITTAAEGDVWEINILRGYAVCAKIGGTS